MGNAGRNGGQYYTPRPLIRAMVQVTDPKLGETIYDAACGSAGFLCESYDHLRTSKKKKLTTTQLKKLQQEEQADKIREQLGAVNPLLANMSNLHPSLLASLQQSALAGGTTPSGGARIMQGFGAIRDDIGL